jgi:hypothetical protein
MGAKSSRFPSHWREFGSVLTMAYEVIENSWLRLRGGHKLTIREKPEQVMLMCPCKRLTCRTVVVLGRPESPMTALSLSLCSDNDENFLIIREPVHCLCNHQ